MALENRKKLAKNLKEESTIKMVALTVLLAAHSSVAAAGAQDAYGRPAKDFTHRKRMIVPASENTRRIDYQALPGRDSLMLPNYAPKFPPVGAGQSDYYGQSSQNAQNNYGSALPPAETESLSAHAQALGSPGKAARKPFTKVSRAGMVPPAPPIKSSLLPASLTNDLDKPPAGAKSTGSASNTLSSQKVIQIKAEAQALVKKGKVGEAQTLLSGYVKHHPEEKILAAELSRISLSRAQGSAKIGNHDAAVQQARLAIIHGDSVPEVALAAHGTLNSSLNKIGVKSNQAEARLEMGSKLMEEGRFHEAEVEYKAAAKLKPSEAAYLGAGGAAMKEGRKLQAKALFQEALQLNPDSQPALRELGVARYHLKDYVGANADLTRALVLNAGDQEAAKVLIGLWHEQVASRPQDATSHLGLARAYQVAGDLPAAQNEYKTVVKINPHHPNLPAARQSFKLAFARQEARKAYELAQTLEMQGSIPSAFQKASDAVALYPSDLRYQAYRKKLGDMLASSNINNGNTVAQNMPQSFGTPDAQNVVMPQSPVFEAPPADVLPTAQAIGIAPEAAAAAAVSSAQAGDSTAGSAGLSTDQHVSSISNFLTSIRDFSLKQQNQIKESEEFQGVVLDTIGNNGVPMVRSSKSSLPSASSGLPPDDSDLLGSAAGTAAGAAPGASLSGSSQPLSASEALKAAVRALANTKGVGAVSATETAAITSAADSATASAAAETADLAPTSFASFAAQARNAYTTNGAASVAALTAQSAPAMFKGKFAAVNKQDVVNAVQKAASRYAPKASATGSLPASVPAPSPAPAGAPVSTIPPVAPQSLAYQIPNQQVAQLNSLQNNNQQLQAQLNQANSYIQQLQSASVPVPAGLLQPTLPPVVTPTDLSAAPVQMPLASATVSGVSPAAPTMESLLASNTPLNPAVNPAMNQAMNQVANTPSRPVKPNNTGKVHLLLQGVKASKDDVQLKVMLRNDSPEEIKLPGSIKALVRSSGQADQLAKASFSAKSLSSGSTVSGTIKIPGRSLDPTADVLIPASSLAVLGLSDIHLTVPISQR